MTAVQSCINYENHEVIFIGKLRNRFHIQKEGPSNGGKKRLKEAIPIFQRYCLTRRGPAAAG
jgi:hypothetical protein